MSAPSFVRVVLLLVSLVLTGAGIVTGCSSPTCSPTNCPAPRTCRASDGACVDLCADKTCPAGFGCRASTGECADLCRGEGAPTCELPLTCDSVSGSCIDRCAGVTCGSAAQACNTRNGQCEDKCKPDTCAAEETCDATGPQAVCVKKCLSPTQPAGGEACASGLRCKPTTGTCVPPCDGVVCPSSEQWCDTETGQCRTGVGPAGSVGTACQDASVCGVPGLLKEGQAARCLRDLDHDGTEEFPAGYCSAACSGLMSCPAGSVCTPMGCLDVCIRSAECRGPDYTCQPAARVQLEVSGLYLCLPTTRCTVANAAGCGSIGADCVTDGACADGLECLPELVPGSVPGEGPFFSGFEGGYCTRSQRRTETCPTGSLAVQSGSGGPQDMLCIKRCTLGRVTGCGASEQCRSVGGTGACLPGDCSADTDCAWAACTSQDRSLCGQGQTCEDIVGGQGRCKTVSKCTRSLACPAGQGTCDTQAGLCVAPYCLTPAQQCRRTVCASNTDCPEGACDTTSGRCVVRCQSDVDCGGSALCSPTGLCVARCGRYNERDVCQAGEVCDVPSGRCVAPCRADADCGTGRVCDTFLQRCVAGCQSDVDCGDGQRCGDLRGQRRCVPRCSATAACASGTFCHPATGVCLPDCRTDPSICGDDACVKVTENGVESGRCGPRCQQPTDCGDDALGRQLTCAVAPGSTQRRCRPVRCPVTDAADVCSSGRQCVDGVCR